MSRPPARFLGSRELHRDLPKVLEALEDPASRCVLTIHGKPKAVLLGPDAFLALLRGQAVDDRMLALQLNALVRGMEPSVARTAEPDRLAAPSPCELVATAG